MLLSVTALKKEAEWYGVVGEYTTGHGYS